MNTIHPIGSDLFTDALITTPTTGLKDYEAYFKPLMEQAKNFAIGPYCWFIPDNTIMKIVAASDNIGQLTPYTQQEWASKDASFLAENIHPDDSLYVLSAIASGAEIHESQLPENRHKVRVNIYGRMLDANSNYRLTLIQFPFHYFNEAGRIESTVFMMTDIAHLQTFDSFWKPIMTIIDEINGINQYFKLNPDSNKLVPIAMPHISKREQEVLRLMAIGLKTPEIAIKLNISYHTVENHKRNLRVKTMTKTSAELMNYVCNNHLF